MVWFSKLDKKTSCSAECGPGTRKRIRQCGDGTRPQFCEVSELFHFVSQTFEFQGEKEETFECNLVDCDKGIVEI